MKCSPFRMFVIVLAIFSIGFQLTGIIAPAWMRYSIELHTEHKDSSMEGSFGLWFNIVCLNDGSGEECGPFFNLGAWHNDGESNVPAMNFVVIKALVMTGECMSVLGFILVLMYFHREDAAHPGKTLAVLAALLLVVCSLIVLGAVGIQGYRHKTFVDAAEAVTKSNSEISFEIYFPWALVVSGIGATLALFASLAVSIRVCCCTPKPRGDVNYTAEYTSALESEDPMY